VLFQQLLTAGIYPPSDAAVVFSCHVYAIFGCANTDLLIFLFKADCFG